MRHPFSLGPVDSIQGNDSDAAAGNRRKIGRNSACPCGSGKKYKRCCWLAEHTSAEGSDEASERSKASRGMDLTLEIFAWMQAAMPEVVDDFEASWPGAFGSPQFWVPLLVHHYTLTDGLTPAEHFAKHLGFALTRRQRIELTREATPWLSIWEVLAVRSGHSFEALDLLTGARVWIRDIAGSRSVRPRLALLGRVLPGEPDATLHGLHMRPLAPEQIDSAVESARRILGGRQMLEPSALRQWSAVDALTRTWLAALEGGEKTGQVPVHNTDSEPIRETEDVYALAGIATHEVERRLLDDEHVLEDEPEPDQDLSLTWTRFGNPVHRGWFRTVIGSVVVSGTRLEVHANSPARASAIRQSLERVFGEHIRHRTQSVADPRTIEAAVEGPLLFDVKPTCMPFAGVEHAEFREHLRQFEHSPHPQLGGRTPRQALRGARQRHKLHRLLCAMEYPVGEWQSHEELARLRHRLGLDDEGRTHKVDRLEREMGFGAKGSQTLLDLVYPLLSEAHDDLLFEGLLRAAEPAWNYATVDPDLAHALAIERLRRAGVQRVLAERYATTLVDRRRSLFDGDVRTFEIVEIRGGKELGVSVLTRAPAGVLRRLRRTEATL